MVPRLVLGIERRLSEKRGRFLTAQLRMDMSAQSRSRLLRRSAIGLVTEHRKDGQGARDGNVDQGVDEPE
jgi:hypothetical protein